MSERYLSILCFRYRHNRSSLQAALLHDFNFILEMTLFPFETCVLVLIASYCEMSHSLVVPDPILRAHNGSSGGARGSAGKEFERTSNGGLLTLSTWRSPGQVSPSNRTRQPTSATPVTSDHNADMNSQISCLNHTSTSSVLCTHGGIRNVTLQNDTRSDNAM